MEKTVRVGTMPGRITEFAVPVGTTIQDLLNIAELDPRGYDVKVDGVKVTDFSNAYVTDNTNLVLLAKMVKGNSQREI